MASTSTPKKEEQASLALQLQTKSVTQKKTLPSWMSYLPPSAVPYIQLMRLDRFNGYWYFWLPHLYGTLLAGKEQRAPLTDVLWSNLVLFWGVLIMRGATCTWNDAVDAPFDRQVSRCKNRPIARGAVSNSQALGFMTIQTVLSILTLLLLPPVTTLYVIPAIIGWVLYPLAKRVTYYPQVVLGVPMAWGVFVGAASAGADPLNLTALLPKGNLASLDLSAYQAISLRSPAICAFYAANVLWTLLYELIYSHQDAAEDIAAGVKNLVLLYTDTSGPQIRFTTLILLVKLAVGQIILLAIAGAYGAGNAVYFTGTVAGAAAATSTVLSKVQLTVPENCAWWFKVGCCLFTGGAMASGLLGEYLLSLVIA